MRIYNKPSFYICVSIFIAVISAKQLNVFSLNENWICNIKKSCIDCLRLPQCSWCGSLNKCFSEKLLHYQNYCKGEKIRHVEYGMSLEENARCACDPDHLASEKNCLQPDVTSVECSGRGKCVCGRCFCDSIADSENQSKAIMGEYCEYDNFSCNDTKCNEGPYNIYELHTYEESNKLVVD